MLPNIADLLGIPLKQGTHGLEQEVEFTKTPPDLPVELRTPWDIHDDNSLRYYGREYVSRGPFEKKDIKNHLGNLISFLNKQAILKDSPRTSFHVHRNVGHLNLVQLWTVACAYWIVENIMMKYAGPLREGNLFCLRLKDAQNLLTSVRNDIMSPNPFSYIGTDHVRYAALNFAAVTKYGSIEFRGMCGHPNLTNYLRWINMIDSIVDNALKFKDPPALLDYYFTTSEQEFATQFLGLKPEELPKDFKDLMEENVGLVMQIAYLLKDWNEHFSTRKQVRGRAKAMTRDDILAAAGRPLRARTTATQATAPPPRPRFNEIIEQAFPNEEVD